MPCRVGTKYWASATQQPCGQTGPLSHTLRTIPGNSLQGQQLDSGNLSHRRMRVRSPCAWTVTTAGCVLAKERKQANAIGRGLILVIVVCPPSGIPCSCQNEGGSSLCANRECFQDLLCETKLKQTRCRTACRENYFLFKIHLCVLYMCLSICVCVYVCIYMHVCVYACICGEHL